MQIVLDRAHGGMHAQGHEVGVEVVETAGEQVGVDRRQLEAGIAQVHGGVERRPLFLPLLAEPVLDGRLRIHDALFQLQQRAGEGGGQMGYHVFGLAKAQNRARLCLSSCASMWRIF